MPTIFGLHSRILCVAVIVVVVTTKNRTERWTNMASKQKRREGKRQRLPSVKWMEYRHTNKFNLCTQHTKYGTVFLLFDYVSCVFHQLWEFALGKKGHRARETNQWREREEERHAYKRNSIKRIKWIEKVFVSTPMIQAHFALFFLLLFLFLFSFTSDSIFFTLSLARLYFDSVP